MSFGKFIFSIKRKIILPGWVFSDQILIVWQTNGSACRVKINETVTVIIRHHLVKEDALCKPDALFIRSRIPTDIVCSWQC